MLTTLNVVLSTFLNTTFSAVKQKSNSTPSYVKYINVKNWCLDFRSNPCIYLPFLPTLWWPAGPKHVELIMNKWSVVLYWLLVIQDTTGMNRLKKTKQNAITFIDSSCLESSVLSWSSSTANRRTAKQYYARGNSRTDRQADTYWKAKDCRRVTQTKNIHNKRRKYVSTKEGLSREAKLLATKLSANLDMNFWWPQCEIAAQNPVIYFWVGSGNLWQWRTIYLTVHYTVLNICLLSVNFEPGIICRVVDFTSPSQLYSALRALFWFKVIWNFSDFIST